MKSAARAGVSVTERTAAKPMAYVLVKARGLKSFPSVASSVKMGRKETVMTSKAKKTLGPTSCIAVRITPLRDPRSPSWLHCSSRLWMFSTTMIEASTMAPMATATPPSDMIFAVSP